MRARIFVVVGPPGTGKSEYLKRQAERAAQTVGPERVLICSLTRTAALNIRARVLTVPERNVGTLHSLCYRMLSWPGIATEKDCVAAWNELHPYWRIGVADEDATDGDDPIADGGVAPVVEKVDLLRHLKKPLETWDEDARAFHAAWSAFKAERNVIDFTDMIERVAEMTWLGPPGEPAVLLVDEAQDLSPLEMDVIRGWSQHVETCIIAGDPDQWLFSWRGAVPELFMPGAVPDDQVIVLQQSWRVPKAAHRAALELIEQCANRRHVVYKPTDVEGTLEPSGPPFASGSALGELAQRHVEQADSGSIMFVAPCSYSLEPLIGQLRKAGIPYHNPYRTKNGRWNPMGPRKGTSMADRLVAFTSLARTGRPWEPEELKAWMMGLAAEKALARGVKSKLERNEIDPPRTVEELGRLLKRPEEVEAVIAGSLDWYEAHVQAALKPRLEFPLTVARRHGVLALRERPRVILGTIHSVKGGEADKVVVSPDLSYRGMETLATEPDTVRRMLYVGMTRTQRDLVLSQPSQRFRHAAMW